MNATVSKDNVLQLVTFTLENQDYGVDILKVQEINRMTEITKVPNSPAYVEGVINLRGKVIPVINLNRKLGFNEKDKSESSRIIIMDIKGVTKGVIVDSVSEVLRIPSDIVEPSPPIASDISKDFIKGIAKLQNRLIILIDIDKLIGE